MLTDQWRRSTRSTTNATCLEARFKKSTRSGPSTACVEVGMPDGLILVRDSKDNGTGPVLSFTPAEWEAFLGGVGAGEFNLPG
jgi:hypothetical protein